MAQESPPANTASAEETGNLLDFRWRGRRGLRGGRGIGN
jgi:hypothetical protein